LVSLFLDMYTQDMCFQMRPKVTSTSQQQAIL